MTEKALLESGLTMNIKEGGTLEGRTVFYSYLRLESKSVLLFKCSSNSEMMMMLITYIASQGLRNGGGWKVGEGRCVHITERE